MKIECPACFTKRRKRTWMFSLTPCYGGPVDDIEQRKAKLPMEKENSNPPKDSIKLPNGPFLKNNLLSLPNGKQKKN
ncbi:hypothetical protein X975_26761, partial [Stegodyphus mimosarum]